MECVIFIAIEESTQVQILANKSSRNALYNRLKATGFINMHTDRELAIVESGQTLARRCPWTLFHELDLKISLVCILGDE